MLVAFLRDADGRPSAIRIQFGDGGLGVRFHAITATVGRQARRVGGALAALCARGLPQVSRVPDEQGRTAALRVRFGTAAAAPATEADAAVDLRSHKWLIEPRGMGALPRVEELWRYRRVLWFMAQRSAQRLYKRTTLGVFWLFARPLAPLLISTLVFGRLLNVPSDGLPYFLFFLAGSASWSLFERCLMWATRSLDQNKSVVKKVYFPRLILPLASVSPAIVDFLVYMGLLAISFVYYRVKDGVWYIVLGPGLAASLLALVLSVLCAISVGLWTSVLNARHRDVRFTLRFVTRFWSYATPVLYPMSQVPPSFHWLVYANPMAPFVETFKWGLLGVGTFPVVPVISGTIVTAVVFAGGFWFFGRSENAALDTM